MYFILRILKNFCLVFVLFAGQSSFAITFFCYFIVTEGVVLCHLCFLMKPRTNFPEQLGSRSHSLDQALVNPNYNSQGQSVDGDVETD